MANSPIDELVSVGRRSYEKAKISQIEKARAETAASQETWQQA
jgi:hypothetical protein